MSINIFPYPKSICSGIISKHQYAHIYVKSLILRKSRPQRTVLDANLLSFPTLNLERAPSCHQMAEKTFSSCSKFQIRKKGKKLKKIIRDPKIHARNIHISFLSVFKETKMNFSEKKLLHFFKLLTSEKS